MKRWQSYPQFARNMTSGLAIKKLILAAFFLVGISVRLRADADSAAQQLLMNAEQQASLLRRDASPLQLDVDFLVQMQVPTQGHLTLKWEAEDRWWRKVVIGNFQQTDIRKGDKLYTSRNFPFTPVRIGELIKLLQFAEHSEDLRVKKQKQRVEHGVETVCFRTHRENIRGELHNVCMLAASHEILSEDWEEAPDGQRKEQFSDYFEFDAHRYPRQLELFIDGTKTITAHVSSLTRASLEGTLLIPPTGAIERRQCADLKRAEPLKTPTPTYPKSASENRLMGDTTVTMTVLTDGSVGDIQLVGTATHSMDNVSLQTLRSWKFKPAMCGTEAVVSDIEAVVSFRLR